MEVTVLATQNTPKKSVIAIRAGSSLRHMELAVKTPFHVPLHGLEDNKIKVSLYEQLGTQSIPDADETESTVDIPVRTPGGECSQVKLRIKRGQASTGRNFKSSSIGAEDYLNHHQLEARIQSLFEIVLKKQPQDPYRCMIEELKRVKSAGEESALSKEALEAPASESSAPKEPVAPAGPPPGNARPSPNAKGRNLKSGESGQSAENDAATKAALAQILGTSGGKESQSLGGQRQAARAKAAAALSNLELAHEVMRMCIRQVVANMASQSSSLGNSRNEARARAIEHAKMVEASHHVMIMVLDGAVTSLKAEGATSCFA